MRISLGSADNGTGNAFRQDGERGCMKTPDKISKKTVLKIIWIVYALASILVWMPQIDRMFTKDYASASAYLSLDDDWDITINGKVYRDVSLDSFRFDIVSKGDEIIMQRTLPEQWELTEGALRFHIRQSAVKMYIDDEMFYEYGYDRMAQNKTVGSGFQFIDFPNEFQGKTLKICFIISEDSAFARLDSVKVYEWKNAYRVLMTENRLPLFLGCFLTIFGLVISAVTIVALAFSLKYIRVLCISLFSLLMGLWTLCYYNVILIFSIPLHAVSLLEYLTLYLAPIPLIIYMREDVKNLQQKSLWIFYRFLSAVHILATAWMIGLHTLDIVHCAATLKYMQALIVCNLIYFIFIEIRNLKYHRIIDRLFLVGMLVIAACIVYDLAGYCGNRYFGRTIFSMRGMTAVGVVIFIFILISVFYLNLTQKMMQEKERDFLIKSAYTDELTRIHNRRYCIEYMNRIEEAGKLCHTVICFDLNNLKVVNDTYGHVKGDILIKSAAEVIAQTFHQYGIVARMGGDEFIAILETVAPEKIRELTEQFEENIRKKNREIKDLNMSVAYGYASCEAGEARIGKVYQLADDRMYEKKKQMKNSGGNHL